MGGIEVAAVDGKDALKQFIELPYSLYRGDPHWVPPLRIAVKELLDRAKHPFYANAEAEFFLARQDGRVVGPRRRHLRQSAQPLSRRGGRLFWIFREYRRSRRWPRLCFPRAWQWLRERGAKLMRGPVNPSTNYECGMLVDGFDRDPMVMMPYNPRYYPPSWSR